MKPSASPFLLAIAAVLLSASLASAQAYTAFLTGAQEVPAVSTTAGGAGRVVIDEAAGTIAFSVAYNGLSSAQTAAHIHGPAGVGVNGPVIINFGVVGGTTGTITGSAPITPTQIEQIRGGLAYINVHSTNFPGGELRGQLSLPRRFDYDGDGQSDYSVLRFATGSPSPITQYTLKSTGAVDITRWGDANLDYPAPGDYDGDGQDDLAVYRAGASPGAQSYFYILRSSDGGADVIPWGIRGDQAVARDYDGDGITDVAVFRRGATSGSPAFWWIRESRTGGVRVEHWGTTGDGTTTFDLSAPADYDGDGRVDLAVYRAGIAPANTFIVHRSSDGGVTYERFGTFSTDWILPGDYDGDGRADLAVARAGASPSSQLVWYILQSSNAQLRVVPFGLSADLPSPGDYDGDGKVDVSVYRPGASPGSQSFFYSLGSFANGFIVRAWGLSADFAVNRVFSF